MDEMLDEMKTYFGVDSIEGVLVALGYSKTSVSNVKKRGFSENVLLKFEVLKLQDALREKNNTSERQPIKESGADEVVELLNDLGYEVDSTKLNIQQHSNGDTMRLRITAFKSL